MLQGSLSRLLRLFSVAATACLTGTTVFGQSTKPAKPFQPVSKFSYQLAFLGQYESNIYHAFADSSEKSAMLNGVDASIDWKYRQSRRVTHRASLYGGLGIYMPSRYDNRNTFDIGFKYDPDFRFGTKLTVSPMFDISRRSKNVIDDISADPARTLKKTQLEAGVVARYDIGKGRFDIGGGYSNNNYDEADTIYPGGATQPLTSWDYKLYALDGGVKVPVGRTFALRTYIGWEKRNYRERKTYTVQYGAFIGRPFAIRSYKEIVISTGIQISLGKQSDVEPKITYTRREDAFENFYGYTQWGYGLDANLAISPRLTTKARIEFKNKDYPNYWNSRIGRTRRESIDYADFSIEPEYQLGESVSLLGYLRNYNKVSNDWAFDYHDLFAGLGFSLRW